MKLETNETIGTDRLLDVRADRLLRVDEVCARLGIGRTKVFELIGSCTLPSVTIGASRRVPESELVAYIQRLKRPSVSQGQGTMVGEE